jgi:hypothetical protein
LGEGRQAKRAGEGLPASRECSPRTNDDPIALGKENLMRGRIPLGLLVGAALLVALGVAGALWAQGGGSAGDTAKLVPADAALYLTVNTDAASRQWVQMAQLLDRLKLAGPLKEARSSGLAFADLDWADDVAPFLGGEATVAVTGVSGDTPQAVVILSTSNGDRAWKTATRALDRLSEDSRQGPDLRSYRGAEIRTYRLEGMPVGLSVAHKDRYLIFATGPQGAQTVLDLAAGEGRPLSGSERFRTARAAVTADPLLFVYVNPSALGEAAEGFASMLLPMGSFGSPRQALRQAGMENAAFAFAASAERTGLRFEWQTVGIDAGKMPLAMSTAPDESRFAHRAPADTLLFLSGASPWSIYQGILTMIDRLAEDPETAAMAREFREEVEKQKRELGFDFEKELLAHLTGEYAVALGASGMNTDGIWLAAMSAVADPAAVSRALQALAAYEQRAGRGVSTTAVGSVSVTESRPRAGSGDEVYAYAITGDELLAGLGEGTLRRVLARSGVLADSPDYREAMTLLPRGRAVTAFVNLGRLLEMVRSESGGLGDGMLDWEALGKLRFLAVAVNQGADRNGGAAVLRVAE